MNVDYDISKWLRLAEMDLSSAKYLFENHRPIPLEIVCFLCQQAVEKIMKGYLFSQNVEAPRIHDLEVLCNMCIDIEEKFNVFSRETTTLTHYGVLTRYPNEIDLIERDAETAIKYAEKIMDFVKPLLNQ